MNLSDLTPFRGWVIEGEVAIISAFVIGYEDKNQNESLLKIVFAPWVDSEPNFNGKSL